MVKTATNPASEAVEAARLATDKADRTGQLNDIENAISEWEKVMPLALDDRSPEDQADILVSYADSLLIKWNWIHDSKDMCVMVSTLKSALEVLPHSATALRYDLLIRLASAHESWYQSFKDNSEKLNNAIQYWEDAYALSVILRRTKEAVCFHRCSTKWELIGGSRQIKSFPISGKRTLSPFRMK
jgi:hypothetical protein